MNTKVKICGVTSLDDARLAAELGAWAVGLIFWNGSPRACTVETAEQIGITLHRRAEIAGVFVNATLDEIALVADRCNLTLLQLHGDEGPAYCREAARRTGARVIKAARVRNAASIRAVRAFHTDFHLLDAYAPGVRGGTGEVFNWELAREREGGPPVILSGGLNPANVGDAIATAAPYAVDTASGTESAPGRKDPSLLRDFFDAVRATEPEPEPDTVDPQPAGQP